MLPLTVFIVSTAWRDETSISESAMSGEMTMLGESNWVSGKGWPIGAAPLGVESDCPQIQIGRGSS